MTQLTSAEIDKLLEPDHATKLWLSVYQPTIVLQGKVNDITIQKGAMSIAYDGLSTGSHLLVASNFIMYVGSSVGESDKGKVRVKSATSTVITVAENSHINWSDDDDLTIVQYIVNEAVFPRIIKDPNDDEDVIFYKDYDVAYTNQNSVLGTFINMGSHYAGFLENGNHNVFYTSSGTENVRGEALSYEWFFQGATTTGSNSSDPGNIAYDSPGHYFTRLITSGTSIGAIDTSYRWISIYDNPSDGTIIPIMNFELEGLSGNRTSGGYTGTIRIRETVPDTLIDGDSLIVVFAEDWYGSTKQSIGGNQSNREKIVFSGYVVDGTIQYDYETSQVEFDVSSLTELSKKKDGFSISVEDSSNPSKWFQLLNMTPKRAIYHFLRWQSTLLSTTDFRFVGDEFDRSVQYYDADRASLYDATFTLVSTGLLGSQVSDRQGTTWFEIDPSISEGTPDTVSLDFQNRIWMGEPNITERNFNDLSYVELNGIAYSGSTGTSTALLSGAPGVAPDYTGSDEVVSGLILSGQTQLNKLSGDYWAMMNSKYPDNAITLRGNYRNYDIAPLELATIPDPVNGTFRGFTFDGIQFYITSMAWNYDPVNGQLFPVVTLSEVTNGFPGTTIIIPVEPPTTGFNNVPPFDLPPLPPFPPAPGLNGIMLLDEGVEQGIITKIDFIGAPVTAVRNGDVGEVTISLSTANDSNLFATGDGTYSWSSGEQMAKSQISFSSTTLSGISFSGVDGKFTSLVGGSYQANISGGITYNSLTMPFFSSTSFVCKFYIEKYNSSDVLLNTFTATGSPAFTLDIDDQLLAGNSAVAYTNVATSLQLDVGDYLKFYAEGFPKVSISAEASAFISISRL